MMKKKLQDAKNSGIDTLDKVSTPTSRAGSTIGRVSSLVRKKVDKEVVALQLSKNSNNGYIYTPEQITGFDMLFSDAKTKVGITKKQTEALIDDQEASTKNVMNNTALIQF